MALLNPKTTIFFAAFLPQFLSAHASKLSQTIVLGSLFVATAAITDSAYVLAAGVVSPSLRGDGVRRISRWLGGSVFIGVGVCAALSGTRDAS